MTITRNSDVFGYFEPEVKYQVLPGCRNCGAAHPLARYPRLPADKCPDCGEPAAQPGEPKVESAALNGISPTILFARAFLAIGKYLIKLTTRM